MAHWPLWRRNTAPAAGGAVFLVRDPMAEPRTAGSETRAERYPNRGRRGRRPAPNGGGVGDPRRTVTEDGGVGDPRRTVAGSRCDVYASRFLCSSDRTWRCAKQFQNGSALHRFVSICRMNRLDANRRETRSPPAWCASARTPCPTAPQQRETSSQPLPRGQQQDSPDSNEYTSCDDSPS